MPPLQTSYSENMAAGAVGRRQNMEEWNTFTGLAEDVESNPIGFAQPVKQGTAGEQVALYDGSGVFRGLTEADTTVPGGTFPEGYNVPVMESGVIWAMAGGTCTIRGPVYWDDADGTYSDTDTDTLIPGAEFDSAASDGELVKIRLRRAVPAPSSE